MKHAIATLAAAAYAAAAVTASALELTQEWDKTFPLSDKVEHAKITFKNRFGIELAADLYKPKGAGGPFAAVAVSGPFGAVKEQVSGRDAQALAERGFLAIAFDPSFTGESGGTPRDINSPDINTDDFGAAVDYLLSRPDVAPGAVGICGICGWGGFALNAAAIDTRVKAYFAKPYHAWERGTNENRNGVVRKVLPKGTSFEGLSGETMRRIDGLLNDRPLRCLGWRTPREALAEAIGKAAREDGSAA